MPATTFANSGGQSHYLLAGTEYDLAATLASGQAFRWECRNGSWEGVIGTHWVRLTQTSSAIQAQTAVPSGGWDWLRDYLQIGVDLEPIIASFPADEPLRLAVAACRGLRLLRQEPWECLASFILSSTKQIVQIQQIVRLVCERYGRPLPILPGAAAAYSFPSATALAQVSELELRACKMGFRAPYLREAAIAVAAGKLDLESLRDRPTEQARARLVELPGVGRKIADCVLLFAYGRQDAFPVDVWVRKALKELYFRRRRVTPKKLEHFSATHFGPFAGYAQQYLFHYMRTRQRRVG